MSTNSLIAETKRVTNFDVKNSVTEAPTSPNEYSGQTRPVIPVESRPLCNER